MTKSNLVFNNSASANTNTKNTRKGRKSMIKSAPATIRIAVNVNQKKDFGFPDDNRTTIGSVHNGRINFKRNNRICFMTFNPTPLKEESNFTPVFRVENGVSEALDPVEFWGGLVGVDAEGNVNGSVMTVQLEDEADDLIEEVNDGEVKAFFLEFPETSDLAIIFKGLVNSIFDKKDVKLVGLAEGDDLVVVKSAKAVAGGDRIHLNHSVIKDAVSASRLSSEHVNGVTDVNALTSEAVTTSQKRRPKRQAAHQAAKAAQQTATKVESKPVSTSLAGFNLAQALGASQPAPAAPQVDAEKEALRKENAELKSQVAELSANVANLTAMMQQFMAAQAASAPVVEEAPAPATNEAAAESVVVEEATPEKPQPEPQPEATRQATPEEFAAMFPGDHQIDLEDFDDIDNEEEAEDQFGGFVATTSNDELVC